MSGTIIGSNCSIGQNVVIGPNVEIEIIKIQNNVSIYEGLKIEDDVFLDLCVFTNVLNLEHKLKESMI